MKNPPNTAPISVVMSTHAAVKADWLKSSLLSLYQQSLKPSEIVLIIDGVVDPSQHDVIEETSKINPNISIKKIQIERQQGLAHALNIGIRAATNDIIARMDSDDICAPTRLAEQYNLLRQNSDVDVICSWHAEFFNEGDIVSYKKTPEFNASITKSLEYRNVISHPTIVARKKCFLLVGGYSETVGFLEDYDLYLRFKKSGFKFYCLQTPLVMVRVSKEQRLRRGGIQYVFNEAKFRFKMFNAGCIGIGGLLTGILVYPFFRMSPTFIKSAMYRIVRNSPRD